MSLQHSDSCIIQQSSFLLYQRFRVPRLFRLADNGEWDKIPKRVARHPREALFVHHYAPRDTALHRLVRPLYTCCPSGDKSSMSSVLSGDTSSSTTESSLHSVRNARHEDERSIEDEPLACAWLIAAVEAILKSQPEVLEIGDLFGRTPLHVACMQPLSGARVQVALLLLRQAPVVLTRADRQGQTPLHHLVTEARVDGDLPLELLYEMAQGDLDALSRRDTSGDSVLDIAARRNRLWVEVLETVWQEARAEYVASAL